MKLNTSPLDAKSGAPHSGEDQKIHEHHDNLQKQLNRKIFSKRQVLSLVSQGNHEIRIELILDKDVLNFG
jgi:hypothetical protein